MNKRKFDWNEISSEEDSDQDDSKIIIEDNLKKVKKNSEINIEKNLIDNFVSKNEDFEKTNSSFNEKNEVKKSFKRENSFEETNLCKKIKKEPDDLKAENVVISKQDHGEKLNLPKIKLKLINSDYKKQGLNKNFNKTDKKEIISDFKSFNFKKKQLMLDKNQKTWFKEQVKNYEDDYDPNFCKKL